MKKKTSVAQIEPVVEFESYFVNSDGNVLREPDNYIVPISSILFLRKDCRLNFHYVHFKGSESDIFIKENTYEKLNEILKEHSTNYINIVHEQDNK